MVSCGVVSSSIQGGNVLDEDLLPEERAAAAVEMHSLLHLELPFALSKIVELLEQVQQEIQPSDAPAPSKVEDEKSPQPQVRSNKSTSPKRIPSPLQFIRGKSSKTSKRQQTVASAPVNVNVVGLQMCHVHSKVSGNGASIGGAALSQGLRNLTKKGIHVAHGGASSSAAPSVSYSSSSGTWMDVSLHMDGFFIRHAKIDLRINKQKNLIKRKTGFVSSGSHLDFSTQLQKPRSPWVLDQVQFVYEKAKSQIRAIRSLMDNNGDSLSPVSESLRAQTVLHDLLVALIEARNSMSKPNPNSFPQTLRTSDNTVESEFHPAPPADLLLEFSVHLDELIVSAYELQYISNSSRPSTVDSSWVRTGDLTNKIFKFKKSARSVQVVDQVQVHFKVHSLQWILENIYEAYNTAIRMLRKLEAFNKHCLMETDRAQFGPQWTQLEETFKLASTPLPPVNIF